MNLLQEMPKDLHKEAFTTILQTKEIKLERIISKGHTTPEGEWYNQDKHEWLTILTGSATLFFEDGEEVSLEQGDQIIIEAHRRHRVTKTDAACETIWLALHYTAG